MPVRSFEAEIRNKQLLEIKYEADNLDHGEWSEGREPSRINSLKTNEVISFGAESADGSIMTGTEGWVLFRVITTNIPDQFLRINFNVPYLSDPSTEIVKFESFKKDPRISSGSGEFSPEISDELPLVGFQIDAQGRPVQTFWEQLQGAPALFILTLPAFVGIPIEYVTNVNIAVSVVRGAKSENGRTNTQISIKEFFTGVDTSLGIKQTLVNHGITSQSLLSVVKTY
jgi:hypothetical protein